MTRYAKNLQNEDDVLVWTNRTQQRIDEARRLWREHVPDCADCHAHDDEPDWTRCLCAVCEIADALDIYGGCQL